MDQSKPSARYGVCNEHVRHVEPTKGSAVIKQRSGKFYMMVTREKPGLPHQTLYVEDFLPT
jgi:hypothetical protein